MGNDPKRSVVDRWNRAHEVPNLFLVDGSSMVTSGRQQPTLTIQALGYRAGEHIAELAKRGALAGGLVWYYARPPVIGLEFEMDVRGAARELVI